ncbi:MAG: hypothetical protein P1U81_12170 [Verrucomicrobiales bacterium]|mgnify:FL=1|jgi:hypothetical protein|nr:hypothetical protein [Verrucomicrobiales bacterium]
MAKRTKLKAGCGLVSVFLVGVFCGAFVLFFLLVKVVPLSEGWRDEESKEFVLNHLANRLKLTDEQIEKIRPIAFSALDERYARRKVYVDADIAITGKAFEEMREILDDAQEKKAEEMFENWKKGKERFLLGEGEVKVE